MQVTSQHTSAREADATTEAMAAAADVTIATTAAVADLAAADVGEPLARGEWKRALEHCSNGHCETVCAFLMNIE